MTAIVNCLCKRYTNRIAYMKKLVFAAVLLLSACSEDNETNQGCLTGIDMNGNRVLIRCSTRDQFAAGSNVSAGGTANWNNFTNHKWEPCDNCK